MSGQCKDCKHYVTLWKYLIIFPLGNYYHKCGKFCGNDYGPIWGRIMCSLNDNGKCQYFINKRNR